MTIIDVLGENYDLFVDWDRRLSAEIPFITKLLRAQGSKKVLDVGCATGMHCIELAKQGYQAFGMDESERLIAKAKKNALEARTYVPFETLAMMDIAKHPARPFDALLMLGNVISMLPGQQDILQFFADAKSVLKTGGSLVIQTLNYRRMSKTGQRFELVQSQDPNIMFVKIFDLEPTSPKMSILMLDHKGSAWKMTDATQSILMFAKEDLVRFASRTKFGSISLFGKLDGSAFRGEDSEQLVAVFRK